MKVTLILADAAQASEGKLNLLGAGWKFIGPDPQPTAIACMFDVDWNEANREFPFEFALLDEDGRPAQVQGIGALKIGGQLEVGRPPGHPRGASLPVPLALSLPPLPLAPGNYVWKLTVNGKSEVDWVLPFTVRGPGAAA